MVQPAWWGSPIKSPCACPITNWNSALNDHVCCHEVNLQQTSLLFPPPAAKSDRAGGIIRGFEDSRQVGDGSEEDNG